MSIQISATIRQVFSKLDDDVLLSEQECAEITGFAVITLKKLAPGEAGRGPKGDARQTPEDQSRAKAQRRRTSMAASATARGTFALGSRPFHQTPPEPPR